MALERACALLTGRLPRRDVSIEIPTAEKAVTYRLTSTFVPWMPTPNLGSRNSDVPPQAPGLFCVTLRCRSANARARFFIWPCSAQLVHSQIERRVSALLH